jgi:RNA polymerase sigma factor (TIGR02999 family)
MSNVTLLLGAAASGDPEAASELFPLVYDELRALAHAKMAVESPDHTLDGTALVHEVYLRLTGNQQFNGRGHFFSVAAESMRRILVDHARGKSRLKRGGSYSQVSLTEIPGRADSDPDLLITLDEALKRLAVSDPEAARLAELHVFSGVSIEEAGEVLKISRASAYRDWVYARAWLQDAIAENP